nr:zinc finger MYM-type protein 1 [Aegilops tauschii subsp. strangulata]XP_020188342.1 zinc finger MYM-type protein 1 [Aegilops tauschii subsp. strangulata]
MKKKGVSIVALWERVSKANKRTSTSTPNPPDVEVESSIIPPTIESNLQLALVQAHEPDDGHTEPESAVGSPTPIVEDDEENDEVQFEVYLEALESDPGKQIPISRYNVNDQDKVRRRYIELGACQPKNHNFQYRDISGLHRRFSPSWFKDYKWLEYSVDKEAAFCFVCYFFKDKTRCPGGDAFVKKGFNNWNMKSRLKKHEGEVFSAHAEAQEKYDRFTTPQTSIRESISSNTSQYKALYKQRLTWTLKCVRFLLHQGLAFRGHDESEDSLNKGNFLELLNWLAVKI